MEQQLSVSLPAGIIYVNGAVNGIDVEFSLEESGYWSTLADKAEDSRYDIELTAYNSLGTPTTYNTVIYYLLDLMPPKVDWTPSDYYNIVDINRVEINTQQIARLMATAGFHPVMGDIIVDWAIDNIPFTENLNRVEGNIKALSDAFLVPAGWQTPKLNWARGHKFDYVDANRLERNIQLIHNLLLGALDNFRYSGTFYAGEEGEIY